MEKNELKINIAPDKAQGVFANLALIAHTPTEFVLDFAQLMPGIQQANVVARVVVTPDQAKKILGALQNNILHSFFRKNLTIGYKLQPMLRFVQFLFHHFEFINKILIRFC